MINGLPERLRECRKKQGLTQRDVARRIDMSPSLISSYESGERTPSLDVLLSLSYLYKCTTDYLLGRKIAASPSPELDINGLSSEQIAVLRDLLRVMKK